MTTKGVDKESIERKKIMTDEVFGSARRSIIDRVRGAQESGLMLPHKRPRR